MKRQLLAGLSLTPMAVVVYAGVAAWMAAMFGTTSLASAAAVPAVVQHQGVVTVNGVRFTGPGSFKFAILDTATGLNLWTNDGTQLGGTNPPSAAVALTITDGIYNVALGDMSLPNMTAISVSIFSNSNIALRIWFDDGVNGLQQLTPDHKLRTVPYAFRAETVSADSVGTDQLTDGAVTGPKLADAAVTQAKIADGAVNTAHVADAAVTPAKLADNIGVWTKSGTEISYGAGNVVVGADAAQWVKFSGGETSIGESKRIGRTLNDSFTYNGKTMGHYSLGWFPDPANLGGPALWESGFGGIRFFAGGQTRMFLSSNGLLTIGNGNSGQLLRIGDDGCFADDGIFEGIAIKNVSGSAYGNLKAYIINPSSRSYKKDIEPLTPEHRATLLKEIDGIEMKLYRYKGESQDAPQHLGVIAEESPARLLSRADTQGVSEHDYASYALLAAKEGLRVARENNACVAELRQALEELRKENADLRVKLDQLTQQETAD